MPGHVVVAGAGVIGCTCAYYLAKAGWRVTLLDRGTLGGGCSHGNCGYVSPSHVLPLAGPGVIRATLKTLLQRNSPLKLRPHAALGSLGWFLNFARRCNRADMLAAAEGIHALLESSRTLYDRLIADEQFDVEWEPCGMLLAFQTPAAFEHFAEVDALLRQQFDTPAERLNKDALLAREPALRPEAVAGGYLYHQDAQLRPDRLMAEWRRVLAGLHVGLRERTELTALENGRAATTTGDIAADAFIIAAGAWTPTLRRMLGRRIPIIPGKGYSITMPRPAICPRQSIIFEEHRVAISPFASGFRIGSTMEFAGYDDSLNRRRLALLTDVARLYLREPGCEPGCEPVQEEWWGWRPMVYDGKPIIGPLPGQPNVIVAAGHGMLGLSMATATGRLACELLTGNTPHIDPGHYAITRF